MAGALTNSSRMGITLQGYHQVIALSQANVNETLRCHFSTLAAEAALLKFEAKTDFTFISAQVLPPTVELIDSKGKDGALYIIHLGQGFYNSVARVDGKLQEVQIPTKDWELAFHVDFAFEPTKVIPANVKRQVPLPGGYSVKQLMINFGDLTRIELDGERSKFPMAKEDEYKAKYLRDTMKVFTTSYLNGQLAQPGQHNILGFAVEVTQDTKDLAASLVPTDSKVQIVGHRVNGEETSFKQDNPYNAVCFTEMTQHVTMPKEELQYSGNWFYDSFGGTMVISRSTFWDKFVMSKVEDIHVAAVEASNNIINMTNKTDMPSFADSWAIDKQKPSRDDMCVKSVFGSLGSSLTYRSDRVKHRSQINEILQSSFEPVCSVITRAEVIPRSGRISIKQEMSLVWDLRANVETLGGLIKVEGPSIVAGNVSLTLDSTINLTAVTGAGGLQVKSVTKVHKEFRDLAFNTSDFKPAVSGAVLQAIEQLARNMSADYRTLQDNVGSKLRTVDEKFSHASAQMEQDLNNGNKFVFPGNGTFDMKDPIFSDAGNLVVGLSYN